MDKNEILKRLDKMKYYSGFLPEFKVCNSNKQQAYGLCPFHDDNNPSLSVNLENGLYNCFSCGAKGDIFKFHQDLNKVNFHTALKEMAKMIEIKNKDIKSTFEYKDSDGNTLYTKERVEPGRDGKKKEFFFKHKDKNNQWVNGRGECDPVLFCLPQIIKNKDVFIVEGEGKVNHLMEWGITATCMDSGSMSPWKDDYMKYFEGKEKIVILPDNDFSGYEYASRIATALYNKVRSLKIVVLPGLQGKEDIIDWAKIEGNNKDKLIQIINESPEWTPVVKDVNVVNVELEITDNNVIPISQFPFKALPEKLLPVVRKLSDALHSEPEMIASVMLAIISGAIGNTISVSVKDGYGVKPFIWLIIIAASGSGKSPVISTLMEHVIKLQRQAFQTHKSELNKYESQLKKLKKGESSEHLIKPIFKEYTISDSTIEALSDVFDNNPRGIISYQDEITGLIFGLNQYKGKGNDRQHYLELFNCQSWKINRKSEVKVIPNTGVSIIGGIQPKAMPKVFNESSFEDGLLPRFLLLNVNNHPLKFNKQGIDEDIISYWSDLLTSCYEIPLNRDDYGLVISKDLRLTDKAVDLWERFYNDNIKIIPFLSEKAKLFIPKLIAYYSLKFAGILNVINSFDKNIPINNMISEEIIEDAINLTNYFIGQVIKTLQHYNYSSKENLNEYQKILIKTLFKLKREVKNGILPLSIIVTTFNDDLPEAIRHTPEKISSILKNLGLTTKRGTHNLSHLEWEFKKIEKLFSEASLTSLTSLTQSNNADTEKITDC